jgi:RecB family exonuclease
LLRGRRGNVFAEYDGNLGALAASGRLWASSSASPTSLETYAGCGFRFLWSYVVRLNVVEEPAERDVMEPAERGSLMHDALDAFFKERKTEGRPRPMEAWTASDRRRLLEIAEQRLTEARQRGRTGLDIFADHDARTILADLEAFLDADTEFRLGTGAVPADFEARIPPVEVAGITMRGIVDRIDRSPDGHAAWVIDYKTGSRTSYRNLEKNAATDPLDGGTKLQLPAYTAAAGAEDVRTLYWFISRQGGFERIEFEPSMENMARFEATVKAIIDGVRQGAFPAVPGEEDEFYGGFENCKYCDFDRICSVRRDQDFDRKAGDAAMGPWRRVADAARGLP